MKDSEVIPRINELCKQRGWSYYRLAKESGITESTLSSMLHRTTVPTIPTLIKLCNGFGISLADFFSDDSARIQLNEQQKALLAMYEELTLSDKRLVTAYICGLLHRKAEEE